MTIAVLGTYPAYCWTRATLVAAAKRFKFFPAVAELHEFHQETRDRDLAAIHVTRELSSDKTRLERLEWARQTRAMNRADDPSW
jgi:hypothetical protein